MVEKLQKLWYAGSFRTHNLTCFYELHLNFQPISLSWDNNSRLGFWMHPQKDGKEKHAHSISALPGLPGCLSCMEMKKQHTALSQVQWDCLKWRNEKKLEEEHTFCAYSRAMNLIISLQWCQSRDPSANLPFWEDEQVAESCTDEVDSFYTSSSKAESQITVIALHLMQIFMLVQSWCQNLM